MNFPAHFDLLANHGQLWMSKAWLGLSCHLVSTATRTAGLFHSPGGTKETKEVSEKELRSDKQAIQQLHAFATGEAT
jgi:hypothetical protein